jgi:hypothetical protein
MTTQEVHGPAIERHDAAQRLPREVVLERSGGRGRNRTADTGIFNPRVSAATPGLFSRCEFHIIEFNQIDSGALG